jgi:hypothetical protein
VDEEAETLMEELEEVSSFAGAAAAGSAEQADPEDLQSGADSAESVMAGSLAQNSSCMVPHSEVLNQNTLCHGKKPALFMCISLLIVNIKHESRCKRMAAVLCPALHHLHLAIV